MSVLEWLATIVLGIPAGGIILYWVARVIFSAYFITRDFHERRRNHGPR